MGTIFGKRPLERPRRRQKDNINIWGWETDGTASGSSPVAGCINGVVKMAHLIRNDCPSCYIDGSRFTCATYQWRQSAEPRSHTLAHSTVAVIAHPSVPSHPHPDWPRRSCLYHRCKFQVLENKVHSKIFWYEKKSLQEITYCGASTDLLLWLLIKMDGWTVRVARMEFETKF
jgi:hypothetical protein